MNLVDDKQREHSTLKVLLPRRLHTSVRMAALSRGESMRQYVEVVLEREVEREPILSASAKQSRQ